MYIEELLKLGAIRENRGSHRSIAFIVRNHAEIARPFADSLLCPNN